MKINNEAVAHLLNVSAGAVSAARALVKSNNDMLAERTLRIELSRQRVRHTIHTTDRIELRLERYGLYLLISELDDEISWCYEKLDEFKKQPELKHDTNLLLEHVWVLETQLQKFAQQIAALDAQIDELSPQIRESSKCEVLGAK